MIYELKEKTSGKKRGGQFKKTNKERIKDLIKIVEKVHKARGDVINLFENKKEREPNFDWIKYIDDFNTVLNDVEETTGLEAIINNKIINLKRVCKFLNDILDGKINDAYTAEKEYIKK